MGLSYKYINGNQSSVSQSITFHIHQLALATRDPPVKLHGSPIHWSVDKTNLSNLVDACKNPACFFATALRAGPRTNRGAVAFAEPTPGVQTATVENDAIVFMFIYGTTKVVI